MDAFDLYTSQGIYVIKRFPSKMALQQSQNQQNLRLFPGSNARRMRTKFPVASDVVMMFVAFLRFDRTVAESTDGICDILVNFIYIVL